MLGKNYRNIFQETGNWCCFVSCVIAEINLDSVVLGLKKSKFSLVLLRISKASFYTCIMKNPYACHDFMIKTQHYLALDDVCCAITTWSYIIPEKETKQNSLGFRPNHEMMILYKCWIGMYFLILDYNPCCWK